MQYDFAKKNVGIQGHPLFWRFGGSYQLANKSHIHCQLNVGDKWLMTEKFELPLNESTKVTFQDRWDVRALFTDPKKTNFNMGMQVEFKL